MKNDQEQGLRILENALWRIANRGDCAYLEDEADRPTPCDCTICVAQAGLDAAKRWRFHGACQDRVEAHGSSFPREVKMHAAWVQVIGRQSPDRQLSLILKEEDPPSARDWYVATSVVQWLATNVGMAVLEAAGFKYQQWEEDRADASSTKRRGGA